MVRFKDGTPSSAHWAIELQVEIIHYRSEAKNDLEHTSQDNIPKLTC